jgi:hypothetical protein
VLIALKERDTEVREHRLAVPKQHVVRLEVAADDTVTMGVQAPRILVALP